MGWKFKKKDKVIALHFNYLSYISLSLPTLFSERICLSCLMTNLKHLCISGRAYASKPYENECTHNDSIDQFWAYLISNYCNALARPTTPLFGPLVSAEPGCILMNKSIGKPPNQTKILKKKKENICGMNNRSALLYMVDTVLLPITSPEFWRRSKVFQTLLATDKFWWKVFIVSKGESRDFHPVLHHDN